MPLSEMLIIAAIALFVLPGALFYLLQHKIVFSPHYYPERSIFVEHAHRYRVESLEVDRRVTLEGMVYDPEDAVSTVLYFGGKQQDSVALIGKLSTAYPNVRFIAFNYRGYGTSGGRPSEERVFADALKVYDWAHERYGDLGLMGYSLGSSVASHVSSLKPVRYLVLVCAFDSVRSLIKAKSALIPGFMIRCHFDTLECVKSMPAPLYLYVAVDDEVVPIMHARNLKENVLHLAEYKEFSGYNHNELLFCDEMVAELKKVFEA